MRKFIRRINWKKMFRSLLWVSIVGVFFVSVGFTEHRRSETLCKEVVIKVEDSAGNSFIDKNDIEQTIQDKFGKLEGKRLLSINISLLEKIIDNNPYVLKAQVFSTIDGKLKIEVKQRNPIVRIINAFNESYYIDADGVLMPLSDKYTARVVVANGNIFNKETEQRIRRVTVESGADTSFHATTLEKIFMLSDYIIHHDFWNAQIEQIYINSDGEMELIPRVGNQTIVFGDEKEIAEKFNKLMMFYNEGLSKTGWNQYNKINLTFKDQVVCTKHN